MAEMKVAIDGAASTAAPITITQGGNTANVAVPGPNLGAGLVVTTGALISSATLTTATTGNGTVADFGSGKANVSMVWFTPAGITAGAVALEVSQDNTNWVRSTATTLPLTNASTGNIVFSNNAFRYARGVVTTTVTGATVSATLMAA